MTERELGIAEGIEMAARQIQSEVGRPINADADPQEIWDSCCEELRMQVAKLSPIPDYAERIRAEVWDKAITTVTSLRTGGREDMLLEPAIAALTAAAEGKPTA